MLPAISIPFCGYFAGLRLRGPFFIFTFVPRMKKRTILARLYACLLLSILIAAQTGQKVHIYTEDHAHFPAFAGDLLPDNGAAERIADRCVVDDYCLFSCFGQTPLYHAFSCTLLAVVTPRATRCRCARTCGTLSLRAPPAKG